jgi:hypothetical protein
MSDLNTGLDFSTICGLEVILYLPVRSDEIRTETRIKIK